MRVEENGVAYLADLLHGQKTGWFYDQRDNRAFMAAVSAGADVLDAYCYCGGFRLACARDGARDSVGEGAVGAHPVKTPAAGGRGPPTRH